MDKKHFCMSQFNQSEEGARQFSLPKFFSMNLPTTYFFNAAILKAAFFSVYHCSVGLMDHRIPDSSFTAFSTNTGHKPEFARYGFQTLNGSELSGYWASRHSTYIL